MRCVAKSCTLYTALAVYIVDRKSLIKGIYSSNVMDFNQQFALKIKVFIFILIIYLYFIIKQTIFECFKHEKNKEKFQMTPSEPF